MSYLPHLSVEAEIDLSQLQSQLEKFLRELRYTRTKEMQVSEEGRETLRQIGDTAQKCAEEISVLLSSQ